jgi:hypothetical protein
MNQFLITFRKKDKICIEDRHYELAKRRAFITIDFHTIII